MPTGMKPASRSSKRPRPAVAGTPPEPRRAVTAAVFVDGPANRFLPTVRSLQRNADVEIVLGAEDTDALEPLRALELRTRRSGSAAALVNQLWSEHRDDILLVTDAVLVPVDFLRRARSALDADPRVATVSFFSNDAAFLSFPYRDHAIDRLPDGHDETTITRRLRDLAPEPEFASIPTAIGGAVLLSASGLAVEAPLSEDVYEAPSASLVEYCQRCRRRGFVDVLDPGTFYNRASDLAIPDRPEMLGSGLTPYDNHRLHLLHPFFMGQIHRDMESSESPLWLAHSCGRTKVMGLRVLVDAACVGPVEMGTQVQTLGLIRALAESDEVAEVPVCLVTNIPDYAEQVLGLPKVRPRIVPEHDLSVFGHVDIGHRPYQPAVTYEVPRWRAVADRVVVSVLDVIAYRVGTYHEDPDTWFTYRDHLRRVVRAVDAVTVISDDVAAQMRLEHMPIEAERVFTVPLGTEHRTGAEEARAPAIIQEAGLSGRPFLLCMGTNYSHKNRDLAIRAYGVLRARGWPVFLVLAGATVPYGSSRVAESSVGTLEGVYVLPDIAAEERNWLLRHASAVLYPSSSEGFGLVPYEAARFGTPAVYVKFGPLEELGDVVPAVAESWGPEALADATEEVLQDPSLARRQVEATLSAGSAYTWTDAAAALTNLYRELLARPPR